MTQIGRAMLLPLVLAGGAVFLAGERRAPAPSEDPSYPALEALEREVGRLVGAARPCVVGVVARSRLERLLDPLGEEIKIEADEGHAGPLARRIGTGVVLDAEGHIATLRSVVSGASEILVIPAQGSKLRARVKGVDDFSGLAVLKVDGAASLRQITFGDSDSLRIGSLVTTLSSPSGDAGGGPAYSLGFVSGMGVSPGPARRGSYIKLNVPSAPGAAGGPVLDTKGRLVGIIFGGGGLPRGPGEALIQWDTPQPPPPPEPPQRQDQEEEESLEEDQDPPMQLLGALHRSGMAGGGASYAVPSNVVRRVTGQIIRTGNVRRGWVGVKIEESEPGEVRLLSVVPSGPADIAGLLPGDRILSFNGEPLNTSGILVDRLASSSPGTRVRLGISRDGRSLDLAVVLGEAPDTLRKLAGHPVSRARAARPVLGIEVDQSIDDEVRLRLGAPGGIGLLVQSVHENSRAQHAGMREGDLILEARGLPVRHLLDLRRALLQQGHRPMQVKVLRRGEEILLKVPPPPPPPLPGSGPAPEPPRPRP